MEASTAEGPVSVEGDRVILATGSGALELPGLPVDHTHILTSDDALASSTGCPRPSPSWARGVIGCELAFIYQAFGSKVTVVEGQNRLLPLPSGGCGHERAAPAGNEETPHRLRAGPDAQGRARGRAAWSGAMLGASPFIKEPTPAQMKETPIEAGNRAGHGGGAPNTAGLGLAEAGVAVDGRGLDTGR